MSIGQHSTRVPYYLVHCACVGSHSASPNRNCPFQAGSGEQRRLSRAARITKVRPVLRPHETGSDTASPELERRRVFGDEDADLVVALNSDHVVAEDSEGHEAYGCSTPPSHRRAAHVCTVKQRQMLPAAPRRVCPQRQEADSPAASSSYTTYPGRRHNPADAFTKHLGRKDQGVPAVHARCAFSTTGAMPSAWGDALACEFHSSEGGVTPHEKHTRASQFHASDPPSRSPVP
jgi:hypothetical protein